MWISIIISSLILYAGLDSIAVAIKEAKQSKTKTKK